MKVSVLLADNAQAADGKLYILGAGWATTTSPTAPMALAILIEVPWTEANRQHRLIVRLLDQDGKPVTVPTPMGEQAFRLEAGFVVGRPPQAIPGTPLNVPIAMNFGPLPLAPGCRFIWAIYIDNEQEESRIGEVAFSTRGQLPLQLGAESP